MTARPRDEAPRVPTALRELRRRWNLATFALCAAWLLHGALNDGIAAWYAGISLLLGGLACALASWSVGRLPCLRAHPRSVRAAAGFCVDGVYLLHHGLAGNRIDREGNFNASLPLYFLAGLLRLYRGSLRALRQDLIRLPERT